MDTYPFCIVGALNVLQLSRSFAADVLLEKADTLMSSASLSVMGQDEPRCNISTNKVIATSTEGNFLVIHHTYIHASAAEPFPAMLVRSLLTAAGSCENRKNENEDSCLP